MLHVHSHVSYFSDKKHKAEWVANFFEIKISRPLPKLKKSMNNGLLHTELRVLGHVIASAAEAELLALFHKGQTTTPLRTTPEELVHQQPPPSTPTYNSTALCIINSNDKQKNQSNGHDIILGKGLNTTSKLLHLLDSRQNRQIGLFYQTSSVKSSHSDEA